jgi:hypothetical protein
VFEIMCRAGLQSVAGYHFVAFFVLYALCWAAYFLLGRKKSGSWDLHGVAAGVGLLLPQRFGLFAYVNWVFLVGFALLGISTECGS